MAKVVGIHRFALKPGVKGADFEHLMNTKVFSGLDRSSIRQDDHP